LGILSAEAKHSLLQIAVSARCIDAWKSFTGDRGTTLL